MYHYDIGVYFSGDGASRDEEGHYQITGRVDDVINTKGHRLGTAELESIMVSHISYHDNTLRLYIYQDKDHRVAETAVVGYGHEDYGEGIVIIVACYSYLCNV